MRQISDATINRDRPTFAACQPSHGISDLQRLIGKNPGKASARASGQVPGLHGGSTVSRANLPSKSKLNYSLNRSILLLLLLESAGLLNFLAFSTWVPIVSFAAVQPLPRSTQRCVHRDISMILFPLLTYLRGLQNSEEKEDTRIRG